MVKHDALALVLFGPLLALAFGGCAREPETPAIRNVVLISIDTLRRDHVGLYGYEKAVSPAIDALGRRGTWFDQAICQAPWTTPSTASFLTSLYPSMMRLGDFGAPGRIAESVTTLAELLRARSFRTCAVTCGGCVAGDLGFAQGFEEYVDEPVDMAVTVARSIAWLEKLAPDEAFFLFMHTYDVHNYAPSEPYRARWVAPYQGALPAGGELAPLLQSFDKKEEIARLNAEDWRHVVERYDAALNEVDDRLAAFLRRLEERGLLDQTLIVLLSDHGEEFGEHGSSGHGFTMYEENLRVPLIFAHPSLPRDRRVDSQVRLLDVAPTIADLLGCAAPAEWQGQSLAPFMQGQPADLVAFVENSHMAKKALRTPERKLIVSMAKPFRELFDLRQDRTETRNLIWDESVPERAGMRDLLARWVERNAAEERFVPQGGTELSEETRREMEALGYVGGSGDKFGADTEYWLMLLRTDQGRELDASLGEGGGR
ncbi:MAG: sulfatase [Planctomycetes bacterium]|nr:sulfatase [Planctomycetota bacterium]